MNYHNDLLLMIHHLTKIFYTYLIYNHSGNDFLYIVPFFVVPKFRETRFRSFCYGSVFCLAQNEMAENIVLKTIGNV